MNESPKAPKASHEAITYAAPMSYAGSTKRIDTWLRRSRPFVLEVLAFIVAFVAAMVTWFVVLPVWYIIFVVILGSVTVPCRLVRRSQREQRHGAEQRLARPRCSVPANAPERNLRNLAELPLVSSQTSRSRQRS